MKPRLKALSINIAKFALAAALIYWLIKSEKITFEPFKLLLEKTWLIPFALGSVFIMILLNNYRWQLLMRGQKVNSTWWETLSLSFMGLFFNQVMPGSVGGDVLKAYYVTRAHPHSKMKTVTSILVDRILGLYAIALIAFVAIIAAWDKVMSETHLKSLSFFIFSMVFGFSAFFALSFSRRIRKNKITKTFLEKIPGGTMLEKLYDALHAFRSGKKEFLIGIFLSLISQTQLMWSLYIIAGELHFTTTLEECFFVIPVGFMATAIPISPAGIGVGQAVFLKLFHWYSGNDSVIGPTLITINQICFALFGLVGAVFYLSRSHERS